MRSRLAVFAVIAVASVTSHARAGDLGTYGATFEIAETDLLKQIGAKLRHAERAGEINSLNRKFAASAQRRIEEPAAVAGLVRTARPRSWLYDPSIVVPEDISDQNGRVFARAGDRINPLERLPAFNRTLVFIAGDDQAQVNFAMAERKRLGADRTVIILTSGAPLKIMRANRVPVYFDQDGLLVGKFGIQQVPATISREGNGLRINEVRP